MAQLMTAKAAAQYLGVGYNNFLEIIYAPNSKIKRVVIEGRVRPMFRKKDIDKYIEELEEK